MKANTIKNKFIFIIGGARSAKSAYAVTLAKNAKGKTLFIATAAPLDEEMEERICLHRKSRPKCWGLIEESRDIVSVLLKIGNEYKIVIIDCLGMLVNNLLMDNHKDKEIRIRIKKLISVIRKIKPSVILVSNDVGSGIVPENRLARRFRDIVGFSNQIAARYADEVVFMQCGIPIRIKQPIIESL